MKKYVNFPSDAEVKRNKKINEESNKFGAAFLNENYSGLESEDSVTIELGELCAYLHRAFRCGANISEV